MTTALDTIRYNSGMAGEEVANMVDTLEDEIESLRQQLASAQEELHFQACLTRDLMPYQERALKSEQQLAAALAACKLKDEALIAEALEMLKRVRLSIGVTSEATLSALKGLKASGSCCQASNT